MEPSTQSGPGSSHAERADGALSETIRRQALLFDALLDAVVITDAEGRIVDWNRAAERLYGYSRAEVLGRSALEVLQPSTGTVVHEEILEALASDGYWEGEVEFARSDGTLGSSETVVIAHRDESGKLLSQVGVNRDITERKRTEAALKRSEERLAQARKMEAVGRAAAAIAHDFNNLLAAIRGNAELALLEIPESSAARPELDQIRQAADSAAAVARQLLSFTRLQSQQPEIIDLAALIPSAGPLLRRLLGPDVELVVRAEPGVGHVRLDPAHLEQILINLAANARDAMPEGGRVTLETRRLEVAEGEARPSPLPPGDYALITVADAGAGIDPETQPRIFEPFFTTRENASGLGLFTVYGIVTQNGGSIEVESTPGEGATFSIILPRVAAADPGRAGSPPEPERSGLETILLVEDEASVRLMAHRLLERRGYRVLVAQDGDEALRLIDEHAGAIDLLLTDMTMPRMSGIELATRISDRCPRLPIILMSGYTDDPVPTGRIGDSPTTFVQKPFSLDVLAGAVRHALDLRPE